MSTFGASLRREREMRGVPLEEIAAATKIGIRTLQALEAEEFSKLPGGIFTRSFIRAYARYLGLEEETVIGEYQAIAPATEEVDLKRLAQSNPKVAKETSRTRLLGLLIAVLLLAAGYALFRYSHRTVGSSPNAPSPNRPATAQPPPQQTPAQTPSPTTAAETPPAVSPSAGSGTGTSPQDTAKSSPPLTPAVTAGATAAEADSELVLQVAASEQAWVAVDADGKSVLQQILKPNDIQTFKAKKSFDVMTGNAQGIILTLNGETLKPLGHRGEVKKVHVTRDDLKNLNP